MSGRSKMPARARKRDGREDDRESAVPIHRARLFPIPPDRNLRRSDSGLTGRQMVYRLIPMRMLMTNEAILSPQLDSLACSEQSVATARGDSPG